jgi:hypothetical protein
MRLRATRSVIEIRPYGAAVTRRPRTMGIRDKPIAPGSSWQNSFVGKVDRINPNLSHLVEWAD